MFTRVHRAALTTDVNPPLPCSRAVDKLVSYLKTRALAAGIPFPAKFFLHDISLNTVFDSGYSTEYAYWHGGAGTADKGSMLTWTLGTAGLLPPSGYSAAKRAKMCLPTASDSVWKIDLIPTRVEQLREMLATKTSVPTLHYVHCEAGCDRTGELSGAYMMKYNAPTLPGSPTPPQWYAADNCSAGRYPNYYSTSALQWCVPFEL